MNSPPARAEILAFVETFAPGARIQPLAGDASTRAFYRIVPAGGPTRVLMDYGHPFEGDTDDIRLARIFEEAGLRVAHIVDVSPAAGCLVLEDLGDRLLESVLLDRRVGGARDAGLEQAVRLAAAVANRGTPVLAHSERADGPALDAGRFRFELDFFLEHFACGLRGCEIVSDDLRRALGHLADLAAGSPRKVLCHRDFHSRNLLALADGSLAMVDIQDARWGPDSYDLASLLRDAYVEIDEARIAPMIDLYLSERDDPPPRGAFLDRFEVVSAQRMLKALGTFGYQIAARGNARYADAVPRTIERLNRLLPRLATTRRLHGLLEEAHLLAPPR